MYQVTYHGLTGWDRGEDVAATPSAHQLRHQSSHNPSTSQTLPMASQIDSANHDLALAPIFQALASAKHISVAPELGDALLNAYFCYQLFEITHRSSFLRDMAFGGPCFSEFLLMVIYACASRMIDGLTEVQKLAQGDLFVSLAKAYLSKDLECPTKTTTIQGLLLLSARECALGDVSQGWNHAGLVRLSVVAWLESNTEAKRHPGV